MLRKVLTFILILVCFVLQSTVFRNLSFAGIVPNLLIILTASFGFMRGDNTGSLIGFICGFLIDIFYGDVLGFYAMIYMYIGFLNGKFNRIFYPEDIKLPMVLIGGSDVCYNLAIYFFMFLFRNKYEFGYYFMNIIVPELVYTMLVTIVLYMILLKINQRLELIEKRSAKKFV